MAKATFTADFSWDTDSFEAAFRELEQELTDVVRGLTVMVYDSILIKTPQFAGRMAASWSYSLNSPQFYDRSFMVDQIGMTQLDGGRYVAISPLYRGHKSAIEIANTDNVGSETAFKLGDVVWVANGVDHGEGGYSADVESGLIPLRRVNQPGTPVKSTLDMVQSKFGQDIKPKVAARLKTLRIGGSSASAGS